MASETVPPVGEVCPSLPPQGGDVPGPNTHTRSWMSQGTSHTQQVMDVPGLSSHTPGHVSVIMLFFFFLMQLKDRYFSNIRVLEITSILLFSLTKQNRQKNSVKKKKI